MKGVEANTYDDQSEMNTSMDEGSQCSESVTLSSPPRSARRFHSRPAGGGFGSAASRLFAEDLEEDGFPKYPSILKPLDLNMELSGATNDAPAGSHYGNLGSRTPYRNMCLDNPLRKRHAEHQGIARDLAFDDVDDEDGPHTSPVDMVMQSPRISPSCYRSPSAYRPAQINKSPCYRTIDGRTVQSKNPFSPMYTDEGSLTPVSTAPLSDSLNFPVSLESGSLGGPFLRHRLQKRETNMDPSHFPSFAASNYDNFTRDGYPERKGRYSFTGSPIREMDFEQSNEQAQAIPHKVRRLSKQEDAPAAEASHAEDHSFIKTKPPKLQMDEILYGPRNMNHSFYAWNEDVSPTDVMSFPPLPGTPVPPTPSKPRNYRGRPKTRYTPVRKPAVPQTPMPERRNRGNLSHPNSTDEDTDMGRAQSRFYSDFDVIGELGNGSFGNVFKVMSRLDGCMYAIKVAHRPAKGLADKDRMLKEVSLVAPFWYWRGLSFSLAFFFFCTGLCIGCAVGPTGHCNVSHRPIPPSLDGRPTPLHPNRTMYLYIVGRNSAMFSCPPSRRKTL